MTWPSSPLLAAPGFVKRLLLQCVSKQQLIMHGKRGWQKLNHQRAMQPIETSQASSCPLSMTRYSKEENEPKYSVSIEQFVPLGNAFLFSIYPPFVRGWLLQTKLRENWCNLLSSPVSGQDDILFNQQDKTSCQENNQWRKRIKVKIVDGVEWYCAAV